MPFSLSPSVQFTETDLTTTVPAVATSIGAIAGNFAWGPVGERVLVTSEDELVSRFGKPTAGADPKDWFAAANFLSYSNTLLVSRVVDTGALNASNNISGVLIENADDFAAKEAGLIGTDIFIAKYPGTIGNNIKVEIANSTNWGAWSYAGYFDRAPTGTETWITVLYDNAVVETFETDTTTGTMDYNNSSMYISDVVNRQSRYVWVIGASVDAGILATFTLDHGADDLIAETFAGFDLFANADEVDVNLIITGGASITSANNAIAIAESRKDCVAFVSPQMASVVNAITPETTIVSDAGSLSASTYAMMDGNYKYQYDKYNDVYRWIPLNGDIAGLCARTDDSNDPWWSPAGTSRGKIKNVVKLAWNPNKAKRDTLYKVAVNNVITMAGEGTLLYGDKTLVTTPSAFGYINVRRLFIVLEKAISTASKQLLFEFNDTFTRNRFINMVEPYLRDVKGRRGIVDFLVIADERVNTGEVVDRGEFVADIYIKPSRSIQNVYLNFVATKTGVVFEELVAA